MGNKHRSDTYAYTYAQPERGKQESKQRAKSSSRASRDERFTLASCCTLRIAHKCLDRHHPACVMLLCTLALNRTDSVNESINAIASCTRDKPSTVRLSSPSCFPARGPPQPHQPLPDTQFRLSNLTLPIACVITLEFDDTVVVAAFTLEAVTGS